MSKTKKILAGGLIICGLALLSVNKACADDIVYQPGLSQIVTGTGTLIVETIPASDIAFTPPYFTAKANAATVRFRVQNDFPRYQIWYDVYPDLTVTYTFVSFEVLPCPPGSLVQKCWINDVVYSSPDGFTWKEVWRRK